MEASRRRVPGELVFAVAMLLFGLTALWLAWRIAGFSSWSSPGVMPMIATAAMSGSALVILRNTLRMRRPRNRRRQHAAAPVLPSGHAAVRSCCSRC